MKKRHIFLSISVVVLAALQVAFVWYILPQSKITYDHSLLWQFCYYAAGPLLWTAVGILLTAPLWERRKGGWLSRGLMAAGGLLLAGYAVIALGSYWLPGQPRTGLVDSIYECPQGFLVHGLLLGAGWNPMG